MALFTYFAKREVRLAEGPVLSDDERVHSGAPQEHLLDILSPTRRIENESRDSTDS